MISVSFFFKFIKLLDTGARIYKWRRTLKFFERERAIKNAHFWSVPSKFCLRRRKFGKNSVFIMIFESSDNQFVRPYKISAKFLKIASPIRKNFLPPVPDYTQKKLNHSSFYVFHNLCSTQSSVQAITGWGWLIKTFLKFKEFHLIVGCLLYPISLS